jgi:hypothetical protein
MNIQKDNAKRQAALRAEAMKNDLKYEPDYDIVLCLCSAKFLIEHQIISSQISGVHPECELILIGPISDAEHAQLQQWFLKRTSAYHAEKRLMNPQFAIDKVVKAGKRGYVCRVGDSDFETLLGTKVVVECCKAVTGFRLERY